MTLAGLLLAALLLVALALGLARPGTPRLLRWFGRLPGDVRIERPGFRLYLPITSMVIASLVLTLVASGLGPLLVGLGRTVSWFGRLPGDLRFEVGGGAIFVPIASMAILGVVATVVANLARGRRRNGSRRDAAGGRDDARDRRDAEDEPRSDPSDE